MSLAPGFPRDSDNTCGYNNVERISRMIRRTSSAGGGDGGGGCMASNDAVPVKEHHAGLCSAEVSIAGRCTKLVKEQLFACKGYDEKANNNNGNNQTATMLLFFTQQNKVTATTTQNEATGSA